jgi:hypothetical protein
MEGDHLTNNFTIYLMLVICVILISVDMIELYRVVLSWNYMNKFDPVLFNSCIKKELILKTIFSVFSFLAAISAFLLCLFLTISVEFFIEKIMPTFLKLIYFIFGPYMLAFTIFGLANWNDVVYICDRRNYKNQLFSMSNMISLVGCFLFSLTITIGVTIYETVMLYIESILRRSNGSKLLRGMFWWAVLRTNADAIRNAHNAQNENVRNDRNLNNNNNANNAGNV